MIHSSINLLGFLNMDPYLNVSLEKTRFSSKFKKSCI
jgi:hypothetical protein